MVLSPVSLSPSLPHPRTRLIGLQDEITVACTLLLKEAVPLLPLTGPGGVGKTRQTLAIAGVVSKRFADGVVWVDLAPLRDPAHIPNTVDIAFGLVPAPDEPLTEARVRQPRPYQSLYRSITVSTCRPSARSCCSLRPVFGHISSS